MHQLFIDIKKAYDSVRRVECSVSVKQDRVIKMRLSEAFITVRVGKRLSDTFPIEYGLKRGITVRVANVCLIL